MKYVVMAGFLVACTLVGPAIAWAQSGPRAAWEAWRDTAVVYGVLLAIGGFAALVMLIP